MYFRCLINGIYHSVFVHFRINPFNSDMLGGFYNKNKSKGTQE